MIARHVMLGLAAVLVVLVAVGCAPAPTGATWNWSGPWPATTGIYIGTRTGHVIALDHAGKLRWEFSAAVEKEPPGHSAIYGQPVVTADAVYVGSYNGKLYRLDPANGTKTWEHAVGAPIVAAPAVDRQRVYVAASNGTLQALDPASGQPRWEFTAGAAIWATPVITGDTVYVASLDHHLYALDPATGRPRWTFTAKAPLLTSPVLHSDVVYVGGVGETLYGVDARTGQPVETFAAQSWFWAQPLVVQNTLFAASLDRRLYALDARTLKPIREPFVADDMIRSSPVVLPKAGLLVLATPFGENNGKLYGLDLATGERRWEQLIGSPVVGPLAAADEVVYVTSAQTVAAFDARGQKLWEYRLPEQK